ncbi:MAG: hypothetical protein IJ796_07610 [Lachnospiraceae bacterium]|nr:hypothetical protein [Lachnospiraceae bacterium]
MKEFLDAFKHLEKLCNEIYGEQHGVTLYINEMEHKYGIGSRSIPDWDRDLKYLKFVRHVRNNLVHETYYEYDYSAADIKFMKDFYKRIMNQEDPLSLLRRQSKGVRKTKKPPVTGRVKKRHNDAPKRVNPVFSVLIIIFIIAAFGFLLWLNL